VSSNPRRLMIKVVLPGSLLPYGGSLLGAFEDALGRSWSSNCTLKCWSSFGEDGFRLEIDIWVWGRRCSSLQVSDSAAHRVSVWRLLGGGAEHGHQVVHMAAAWRESRYCCCAVIFVCSIARSPSRCKWSA
jgi:hypothetical protein